MTVLSTTNKKGRFAPTYVCKSCKMDILISYSKVVKLVANPHTFAPHPNCYNLCALRCHLQCPLQHLSCPQSNILGWSGVVMSHPMYLLLSRTAFRLPNNPSPQAIYYGPRTPIVDGVGNPVLDANGNPRFVSIPILDCATQAIIDASFVQARSYWLSYQNIK